MKKILLIITSLFSLGIAAQQEKFEIGLKLAYVNSSLDWKVGGMNQNTDPKHNILLSIPMQYRLHQNFTAFAEVAMAGLGGENLSLFGGQSRLHLTTILFPVGIKYHPIDKVGLIAGYNFGIITKALGRQNGQDVEFEDISKGNSSVSFGAEYRFLPNFAAEAKYNIGTSNITGKIYGSEMKNNFVQVGIAYFYGNNAIKD